MYLNTAEPLLDIASRPLPLRTSTKERLLAWAHAPGGRGELEGELELGGFFQENMKTCANVWPSHSSEYVLCRSSR
jgi:alpha 1,2-mannosyltransferase